MRIGYDAKRAFNNTTGLGNYSRTLIQDIEKMRPDWPLFLFTPFRKVPFSPKSQIITPNNFVSKTLHPLWRSYGVLQNIAKLKLDLFHGLSHEIPHGVHRVTKTVVTIHDLIFLIRPQEFKKIDRQIYNYKIRYATQNAHHVLTFTEDTKKNLIHYLKVPEKKITLISQSCHPAFLKKYSSEDISECRRKLGLSNPYIHFVGSFIPRKKPMETLLAFERIANNVNVNLVMIGNGTEKKACQHFVTEKNLNRRVHFISLNTYEEMTMLYQGSELLLYPSVAEGFGLPILEAHFSKIPVITSTLSCLPEVAGPYSYYTNPNHIEEFANQLQEILNSPEERASKAQKSHLWAQKFAPQKITNQLIQFYESL